MARTTLGLVRFSYAHVWEPQSPEAGKTPKYSVCLIIPKSDKALVDKIKKHIKDALEEGKTSKFNGKIPPSYKDPLRDGDLERPDDEAYENSYFINANSEDKPEVVDKDVEPILDKNDFYSGCFGRASVNFFAFNTNGNKGVGVALGNIQKLRDGDRMSAGRSSAKDDFGSEEDDDLMG